MRARNDSDRTAFLAGGTRRRAAGFRSAASLGVLALVLGSAAACGAPSQASGGPGAPADASASLPAGPGAQPSPDPAPSDPAPAGTGTSVPAAPGTGPSLDPAPAAAKARVQAALDGVVAGGAKPGTDRARAALTGAGFTSEQQEVTASTTPTGLDADAVEAAVKVGNDCIVAQLRTGSVTVSVLPALSDGRCLVGTRV